MTADDHESGLVRDRQSHRHGIRMDERAGARTRPASRTGGNADRASEMADQAALLIFFLVQ